MLYVVSSFRLLPKAEFYVCESHSGSGPSAQKARGHGLFIPNPVFGSERGGLSMPKRKAQSSGPGKSKGGSLLRTSEEVAAGWSPGPASVTELFDYPDNNIKALLEGEGSEGRRARLPACPFSVRCDL